MPQDLTDEAPLFGYLTVVDDPTHGLCGGYLVVNQLGRPVEFHCTAAVNASRAQQILYGPTLRSSLYGEQIGPSLVNKAKSKVAVVFVNQSECVELEQHSGLPVVLIAESNAANQNEKQLLLFPELFDELRIISTEVCEKVGQLLSTLAEAIDLAEPFERIREAIYEAQQIGGEGQGTDARAA